MKHIVIIALLILAIQLAAQERRQFYQFDSYTHTDADYGPGDFTYISGTKYVYNYYGSVLLSITKYTGTYYHPEKGDPDRELDWILQYVLMSDSQYWVYEDGFEIRELCMYENLARYRQTRYTNDGYILWDKIDTKCEMTYSYSPTMRLLEKIQKIEPSSYTRWNHFYDPLDRRSAMVEYRSADSLNWVPYKLTTYSYTSNSFDENWLPDKYRAYVYQENVPIIDNYFEHSGYITHTYSDGNWINPNEYPVYIENGFYNSWARFTGDGLFYYSRQDPNMCNVITKEITWNYGSTPADDVSTPSPEPILMVHPNPFQSRLGISFKTQSPGPLEMQVYNLKGQLVFRNNYPDNQNLIWDGRDNSGREAAQGLYLIRILQNGRAFSSKALKMK